MDRFLFAHNPLNPPENGKGMIGYIVDTQHDVWVSVTIEDIPVDPESDSITVNGLRPSHNMQFVHGTGIKSKDIDISFLIMEWYEQWLEQQGRLGERMEILIEPTQPPKSSYPGPLPN